MNLPEGRMALRFPHLSMSRVRAAFFVGAPLTFIIQGGPHQDHES